MFTKFVILFLPCFVLSEIVDYVYKFKKHYVPGLQHTISYQEEGQGILDCGLRFAELATFAALAVVQNADLGYTCRFYQEALVDEALEFTDNSSYLRTGICTQVLFLKAKYLIDYNCRFLKRSFENKIPKLLCWGYKGQKHFHYLFIVIK